MRTGSHLEAGYHTNSWWELVSFGPSRRLAGSGSSSAQRRRHGVCRNAVFFSFFLSLSCSFALVLKFLQPPGNQSVLYLYGCTRWLSYNLVLYLYAFNENETLIVTNYSWNTAAPFLPCNVTASLFSLL